MESAIWTKVGELSDTPEFDGDVSAALETLCREAIDERELEDCEYGNIEE